MNLTGRASEIAQLESMLDDAADVGRCLLLTGPPGVGKSALLAHVASVAESRMMTVVRLAGSDIESTVPFAGLRHLISTVYGRREILATSQRAALEGAEAPTAGPINLYLVGLAVLNLLEDRAAATPLVLVADDVQWFDEPSSLVLSFVAQRLHDGIVLIASCDDDNPLWRAGMPRLEIVSLGSQEAASILNERAPTLSDSDRASVLRHSEGNPLALVELSADDRHSGVGPPTLEAVSITERLEGRFAARARALPSATQSALLVVALNRGGSLEETLAAAERLNPQTSVLAALRIAHRSRLVALGERTLSFAHPLIRSAILQAAGDDQRRAVHAALATAMADEPDRAVWHAAAGAAMPDEDLACRLEALASQARQRGAVSIALKALTLAANLSESPEACADRLITAVEIAHELGRTDETERLLRAALALVRAPRQLQRLRRLDGRLDLTDEGTVRRMVALAHRLSEDGGLEATAEVLLHAAISRQQLGGGHVQQEKVAAAADRLELEHDDARIIAIYGLGSPTIRREQVLAAALDQTPLSLAATNRDGIGGLEDMHLYGLALASCGEGQLAMNFQTAAIEGLQTTGRRGRLSRASRPCAVTSMELGNWILAVISADACTQALRDTRGAPRSARLSRDRSLDDAVTKSVLATLAAYRGDTTRVQSLAAAAEQILAPLSAPFAQASLERALTAESLTAGRFDEALDHAARVVEMDDSSHLSHRRSFLMDIADAALLGGDTDRARAWTPSPPWGEETKRTMSYVCAVLSDGDPEVEFLAAVEALRGQPIFIRSRVALAFGTWLHGQRRISDARPLLRTAGEGFALIGAVPWAARAAEQLRAGGEHVADSACEPFGGLTAQEIQIARHAADGHTNSAIASRLFLSHRAVGSHLYDIFLKLEISSRAEIALALEDLGLTRFPADPPRCGGVEYTHSGE